MKLTFACVSVVAFAFSVFGQDRSSALAEYLGLKDRAAVLERIVLLPDKSDIEAATREGLNAMRILPREKYTNSYSSVVGGGSYFSFFYRYHDYGWGSDLGLEQEHLYAAAPMGMIADLGELPLQNVHENSAAIAAIAKFEPDRYQIIRDSLVSRDGLMVGETKFVFRLKPVTGRSYLVRAATPGYYDVLVAFQLARKDADGSLVLFWRLIEQYDTPQRDNRWKPASDADILKALHPGYKQTFAGINIDVKDGIATLSGSVERKNLSYVVQLVNSFGSRRVINNLELK